MSTDKLNETEIEDIYCLPQNPQKVSFEEVQNASAIIRKCIQPTPCTVIFLF